LAQAVIGLAVPGRPIRSLVAENQSADGVRDRTGLGPLRSALGPQPAGKRRTTARMSGHRTFVGIAGRWSYGVPDLGRCQ
jgi:hypothetical protein